MLCWLLCSCSRRSDLEDALILDCTMYNGERDLLEIRLATLARAESEKARA